MTAQPVEPPEDGQAVAPDTVTYEQLHAAIEAGADCARLFALRNGMHPKDPARVQANEDLRSVGCHASWSTRRDDL